MIFIVIFVCSLITLTFSNIAVLAALLRVFV